MRRMHVSNQAGWTISMLGLLIAGSGCGDSDGGGASKSSGVPSSKPAAEVTDAEAVKLCEWANEQGASLQPSDEEACTYVAVSFSQDEASCKDFVKQCLDAPAEEPTEGEDDEDDCSDATAADIGGEKCTATVGEIESCIRDLFAAQSAAFENASCADAGKMQAEQEPPASCKKIETTCPGAFGDDQDDMGGGMSGGQDVSGTGGEDVSGTGGDTGGVTDPGVEEFTCDGGTTTYSDFDACDGFEDCADGADEAGC